MPPTQKKNSLANNIDNNWYWVKLGLYMKTSLSWKKAELKKQNLLSESKNTHWGSKHYHISLNLLFSLPQTKVIAVLQSSTARRKRKNSNGWRCSRRYQKISNCTSLCSRVGLIHSGVASRLEAAAWVALRIWWETWFAMKPQVVVATLCALFTLSQQVRTILTSSVAAAHPCIRFD